MKVVLAANFAWNLYNFRKDLILNLKKKNDVYLICNEDKYSKKLKSLNCPIYYINQNPSSFNIISFFFFLFQFIKILIKIKPNILIAYTFKINLVSIISRIFLKFRLIINLTGIGGVLFINRVFSLILINLYSLLLNFSDKVIFQNKDDLKYFKNNFFYFHDNFFLVEGSGINLTKVKDIKKLSNKRFTFGYIGRFLKTKGFLDFCFVAHLMNKKYPKQTSFFAVGSNKPFTFQSVNDSIIKFYKSKKIIKFLPFQSNVKKYIEIMDCIVLPSYREGTSKIILEAGSMGKLIIASNVPGCNNIIKNNLSGILHKVKSRSSLMKAMEKAINLNKIEYEKITKKCQMVINNKFNKNIYIKKMNKIIFTR